MPTLKKIPNPHLLTPKARAIAEGRYAINITEADWQSLYDFWDREAIVNGIIEGLAKHFTNFDRTPCRQIG